MPVYLIDIVDRIIGVRMILILMMMSRVVDD